MPKKVAGINLFTTFTSNILFMARNQTSYAIKVFLSNTGMTHKDLARRLQITPENLSNRITRESFTDFERKQLETLGVDFSVSIV